MNRPEERLQRQVAQYLDACLPPEAVWWHTPNQRGTRKKYEAQILKALGVKPGVPDCIIIYRGRAIFIELKAPKGSLSVVQKDMRDRLTVAGGLWFEARTLEQVEGVLSAAIPDMRGRIAA